MDDTKVDRHFNRISSLRVGLGTFVAIDADASSAEAAQLGIAAAFEAIARVDQLMHPTRGGSDLAALRACPQEVPLCIHPWTWELLELCQHLNRMSHGTFDPCLPESSGRITDVELLQSGSVVPHGPVHIDLGGIAKGYAVDRALEALRLAGCCGGLVNAGGDLAVFGARAHTIFCRDDEGNGALVELKDAALATSDTKNDARPLEHRGYYLRSDLSAVISGKISIVAGNASIADALTKCLLIGDPVLNDRLLDAFGARRIDY
jgi:FAD:protein FMN transferase